MRPVFLFVDLLEDFFQSPPLSQRRNVIANAANDLLRIARSLSAPVIWVRQEFEDDLSDAFLSMRRTGRRVTIKGTKGCELLSELQKQHADHEIVKKRYSAFFGTELDQLLQQLDCAQLVICGVNTQACVRMTAIDAYQRDIPVLFAKDAISSYDEEFHRESMRYLEQSIGSAMSNPELENYFRERAASSQTC